MAILMQIDRLTKSVGDRMLFSDVTVGISEGDKIGLIAKNGTGKTTLLRCITGIESADSGTVVKRDGLTIGFLEQAPHFDDGATITTEAARIADEAIEKGIHSDDAQELAGQFIRLVDQLGENRRDFPLEKMSGGQRKRVALAAVLASNPQVIILDEPTNHLDIPTVEWLESYLRRTRSALLMVTHDRYFLDRVTNQIIEIDGTQLYTYNGNFDYYLRRRAERIEAMTADLARSRNTLRREQEWMNRQPQARAGKAKFRIDAFHELKSHTRSIDLREKNVELNVKSTYIGSKIFEAKGVTKHFGEKLILDDFTYTFSRYEKVGIIGPNGAGKSTFIKLLQGIIAPDSGEWNLGETVRFGYYCQEGLSLDQNKTVADAVTELAEDIVINGGQHFSPMQFLQKFLFSPADQRKKISTLSGGERSRLHLATVLMQSPNFLILDEPTNDLDIITLGILEEYLSEFKGCAIIVSHDRFFLDTTVDHLFVMEGNGTVLDFPGTYTEYAQMRDSRRKQESADNTENKTNSSTATRQSNRPPKLSFKERKELEQLTTDIDALSIEKKTLEAVFNGTQSDERDISALAARYKEITEILDEKELRWLELSEKE
ncbi:MAG: ABC-F family ATP-binding cassette domain-containing protein [Muribaculaceae bacterium]|nr:ABC-F family ATP-binding cassette domain-containing protein [Muribaculaceae bacterium]